MHIALIGEIIFSYIANYPNPNVILINLELPATEGLMQIIINFVTLLSLISLFSVFF